MALDVWCRQLSRRSPFFFVAPEDRGGQQQHGPASIWQVAEVIAIVQRTREATRSSAFACELRAADSPRPLAVISNMSFLDSRLLPGWPKLRLKGDFLQYSGPLSRSCSCGKNHRVLRGMAHRRTVRHASSASVSRSVSGHQVLEAICITLRDGVSIQDREVIKSDRRLSEGKVHGYYFITLVHQGYRSSPDSHMGCFPTSSCCFVLIVSSLLSLRPFRRRFIALRGSHVLVCRGYVYFSWNGSCWYPPSPTMAS